MSRARRPLPTDLVALITHDGHIYPNEAKTWDRMGEDESRPHPLETALEQWLSFATGKHTWVNVHGATIRGLVSARSRAKRTAWEVDCLINADDDHAVTTSLLERMSADVGRQGAERVFLRLAAGSPVEDMARGVGFFTYAHETLFRAEKVPPVEDANVPLRQASKADAFGVYQLYSAVTPANVRAIEGSTFREWQAAREPWGGNPVDLVMEEHGVIAAWVRVLKGNPGRFALIVHPDRPDVDAFLHAALSRLTKSSPLLCLASAGGDALSDRLRDMGFTPVGDYLAMAKRLTKHAKELSAETFGTAVTAS